MKYEQSISKCQLSTEINHVIMNTKVYSLTQRREIENSEGNNSHTAKWIIK